MFTVFVDKGDFGGSYNIAKAKRERNPKYSYLHCIIYFKTSQSKSAGGRIFKKMNLATMPILLHELFFLPLVCLKNGAELQLNFMERSHCCPKQVTKGQNYKRAKPQPEALDCRCAVTGSVVRFK